MAGIDQNTLWQLASMILGKSKAQPTTRERATFLRTDSDGTQWVRLPSSNDETPVNGRTLATAKAGDTVEWSIDNGRLSITGNSTSPSVGSDYVGQEVSVVTKRVDAVKADIIETNELLATKATITELEAESARIDTIEADVADIDTIRANSAKVQNLTAAQLEADHAKVSQLDVSQIEADHATIGNLDTTYMHANMSNSDVAWIQNGTIKDGAITNAMINSVSANKLTAGTIDASEITVTNLNADNITTGTINGQRIGEGSLSLDKLSENVYTESEVDNIVDGLNDRIDGAIETHTGTAVPTLNNQPASSWNTTKLRDEHVGDVYYVVNSQSQQNGYCYRFTKSGSTYSWQLIKDSDVTAALSRLTTAEGKITTFDSDISKLKTDTGTLTTKTESLETRMSDAEADILDKVDTTTFNEVSDTVDQHSQTISQHTAAISNKADGSTVTAVTNRVSKNEQDISGINTTIGELQETVESKADGSTVSTISNKLNNVSDTVDGHTQTLTSVQNTLSSKADSSTVSTLTTKVNNVSDTVDGHTSQLSSITTTQITMQGTLDKTVKSSIQLWYSKANTTAPSKPTSQVTSTSTSGNDWRTVVPAYNASYPHYFYCWQYEYVDGTYGWSAVVRDIAMGESQSTARTAGSTATNAQNTANANIKSSVQLWFTKADSTAPNKPTSVVSTSNANTANAWNLVVPVWNSSYPHYFYCYQQQKGDGNYQWTDVVYDRATSEAQQLANTTSTSLSTLQTNYATFKQTTEQFESTVGTRLTTIESDIDGVEERVSSNETSISNNASAIALRATKAEVQSMGGNLLMNADNPVLGSNIAPTYAVLSGGNGTGTIAAVTDSPLPDYKKSFRITGNTSGNRDFGQSVGIVYGQNYLFTAYARGIGGNATALVRVFSGSELFTYTTVVGTDWTQIRTIVTLTSAGTAAYKYFQFGLTGAGSIEYVAPCLSGGSAANTAAELKVQADRIGMVVSNADASSSLQLTPAAITAVTNNLTIKDSSGSATVISGGKIQANSLTIGDMSADTQANILNSNISVGGRNLLHGTSTMTAGDGRWDTSRTFRASGGTLSNVTTSGLPIRGVSGALRVTNTGSSAAQIGFAQDRVEGLLTGETYTQGAWVRASTTVNVFHQPIFKDANRIVRGAPVSIGTDWTYISYTGTLTGKQATDFYSAGYMYAQAVPANGWLEVCGLKLEKGNKATDWSPAPEDVDSAISDAAKTATSYVTNITGGGIMVHPSDDATSGVRITSDVDIMRGGTSVINIGTNDAVRIGVDDNAHVKMLLESDSMEIDNEVGDEIFVVEANRSGTTTETVTANDVAVWSGINDVTATTTYTITDAGTTSGTATAIVTVDNVQYELDSSQATTTVTVGSNVTAKLTSSGVTYVRGLMTVVEEDEEGVETTTYLQCSLSVRYVHIVADSAIMALDGRQVINGERKLLTLSNDQWSSSNETDNFVLVETKGPSNKTYAVAFGVGSSGSTRGVYDSTNGDWIIYRNSIGQTGVSSSKAPIVINGTNFSVDASGNVRSVGTGYLNNLSMTGWVRKLTSDWSSSNQKATFLWTENSVTGQKLAFGITNNGYHRGIYDGSDSRWIVVKYQSGQVLYNGLYSNFDAVSVVILSGTTIAAGGLQSGTTDISKSGWYPIAIAGWTANTRYATPVRYYLSARGNGTGTISWFIHNTSSNAQAITASAYVLWARGD